MVMFIGQVERGHSDREAFQEIEYRRFLEPLCKWVVQIDGPGADSGTREPGVSSRMLRTAGARGRRVARGHAGRGDHRGRRGPVHRGLTGRSARCDSSVARVALARPAPAGRGRRRGLVGAGERGSRTVRGGERAHHRGVVPLPGSSRQHPSLLRGRPWTRNRSEARRTGSQRRPAAGDRRKTGRDDDPGLSTRRASRARGCNSCTCIPILASSAGCTSPPSRSAPAPPSSCVPQPRCLRWTRAPGGTPPPEPTRSTSNRWSRPAACRGRWRWARSWHTCASGSHQKRFSPPTPATSPRGCTGTTSTEPSRARSVRPAVRWVTEFRPPSPPVTCIPTVRRWHSAATAAR